MAGGVKIRDQVSYLGDQLDFLLSVINRPTLFLLGFFFCPSFLGFAAAALIGCFLGSWVLYLAIVLPVLPILIFLGWCLLGAVVLKEIIAYTKSEPTPCGDYSTRGVQQTEDPRHPLLMGKRQALREQLLRACDESFLQRRVAQLARKYRIMDVRVNAHLRETSYMLERFLDTLLQHEDSLPDLWEHLSSSPRPDPFTVAFHGTPPENIPSILAHGLLPTCRVADPESDYFSTELSITRAYVHRNKYISWTNWYRTSQFQAVVFLLLKEPDVVAYDHTFITRRHAAYQLPLGVVTVEVPQDS